MARRTEGLSLKYVPHGYQRKGIKFGIEYSCVGLLFDPGMGKTSTVYAIYKILRREKMVTRALVISPLRPAYLVWPPEAEKWDDFNNFKVRVLQGRDKEKLLREPHDISVINPEGLEWLLGYNGGKGVGWVDGAAEKAGVWWEMLVVDESTKFKNSTTERFKVLRPWLPKFRRRIILTGTPAPNGLLDLFGQIYIIDLGHTLGTRITHFRNEFFDRTGFMGYSWKPREGADEIIYKRLAKYVLRLDAADYLKLEPYIPNTVEIELDEDSRRAYTQMELLMIAQINDNTVTAVNAGALSMKCRQIANGGIFLNQDEGAAKGEWTKVHDTKTEAVQEIVEELGGKPALVAYEFRHDLQRLQEAFPDAPYLGGGVSAKRASEIARDWNAGRLPVLLAQPQSVAHGLNLQGTGSAVIWHSLTWNLENYEQLIRRVWRQGQKERVVVHHIVAKDTVDELMMKTLARKDKVQKNLLQALKELAKSRSRR